ncbi:dUTP diphosphatase [Chitinispirillales bacterium ANBcel5]|uniref:dUTP diphosphatase n=1 Tax=Cellulosispirillum alkaliphilum TaxID=3039283 RepID=UPI002A56EAA9|nr:dUTP diphosphatase [Chitinispirillales bacterium ANBcel5]
MTRQYISVKKLDHADGLAIPCRMTPGSSGCDISAAIDNDISLAPMCRAIVPTGLCFEIPQGLEVQVRPRSGLAFKSGVTVLNAPGTIDSDYRGEVKILLINLGNSDFVIKRGDRIAQLVPVALPNVDFIEQAEITETTRGAGGFGHTGLQ